MAQEKPKSFPKLIILLFIVGFFIRVGFIVISKSYVNPHDWEYGEIARNVVTGNGYARATGHNGALELTSSHAPLYPYFLALFYGLEQKTWVFIAIQLIQTLLSSVTILIFYRIASLLFGNIIASITSFGVALYPPLIYYSAKMTPTTFFIFLMSLTLLLILEMSSKNIFFKILAGIVLGLSLLCGPLAFALFPALIIWYFIKKTIPLKEIFLVIIISLIVLVPWTIRNYSVHHCIVPVTTQFGVNFWIGNNPNATGTDYYRVFSIEKGHFILMTEMLPYHIKRDLRIKSEIERSQFFFNQGIKFIKHNPQGFFKLLLKKIHYYWWFAPQEINASVDVLKYKKIYTFFYLPVFILGLLGIAMSLSRNYIKNTSLIILTILFISSTYVITHVGLVRYRVPLEACFVMFASFSVVTILQHFVKRL